MPGAVDGADGTLVDGLEGEDGEVAAYAAAPLPTTAPARARATIDFRSRDVRLIHLL